MRIAINVSCLASTGLFMLPGLSAKAQSAATGNAAACVRAVYQLDYKLDSAVTTPKRTQMILRVSNGYSRFQNTGGHLFDSVYTSLSNLPQKERFHQAFEAYRQAVKNEFRYTILKEPARNYVSYHDAIGSQDHQYVEKAPLFAWRITPVKKTIAGHECQQAFAQYGGRVWEAWFARDVPVSDGPYKFYGLPGLILQVRDTHDHYVFSLLCLDTSPQPFDAAADTDTPLAPVSSAPLVSKSKFRRAKHNDELTFMDQMLSWGNKVPESMQQDYYAELKRRNNPLERN